MLSSGDQIPSVFPHSSTRRRLRAWFGSSESGIKCPYVMSTSAAFSWPNLSAPATTDPRLPGARWRNGGAVRDSSCQPVAQLLHRWSKDRAPSCSCRYRFPLAVVKSEPSSIGGNSSMCAASALPTTSGNGSGRRDLGVLGGTRYLPSGVVWNSTRTVRRRKSTSCTRSASTSATRRPRPAWVIRHYARPDGRDS
jgi:hypothetical protein